MKNAALSLLLEQFFTDSAKKICLTAFSEAIWAHLWYLGLLELYLLMFTSNLMRCWHVISEWSNLRSMTLGNLSHLRGIYSQNDKELIHRVIS